MNEHRRILDALRRRSFDTCRRMLREHFDLSVAALAGTGEQHQEVS